METMQLKEGALLQGGKYRIESVLGQGGFGITYMAVQTGLNRKVAIKEFFMKDLCNRDADTSHVSVPSVGSKELVEKFRVKFVKEAQTIAGLSHPNIIRIHDIFEENGTAYYVMEYHGAGSLADMDLPMPTDKALGYVRQIGSALDYLHSRNVMHLDVKPSNVLVDDASNAVLIDFGVSKRYDESGHQTSSTPVGISHGYAPIEQYSQSTLTFSPATDIYALGATLYKLLTGQTPPEASVVNDEGLPEFPNCVPAPLRAVIEKAMQSRRKDRPQSIEEFFALLDECELTPVTVLEQELKVEPEEESVPELVDEPEEAGDTTQLEVSDADSQSMPSSDSQSPSSISSQESPLPPFEPAPRKRRLLPYALLLWTTLIALAVIYSNLSENGRSSSDAIEYDTTGYDATGYDNGHGYVDLGLPSGLKWATCNVGASSPEDYGDYYAWGDLKPMTDQYHGTPCREEINISGNPKYDVARAKWGGSWRMPTEEEFKELHKKCTWEWTTKGGHTGYKVTGPNGNSIFLPASGYRFSVGSLYGVGYYGDYWSASPDGLDAYRLGFSGGGDVNPSDFSFRALGLSVRCLQE